MTPPLASGFVSFAVDGSPWTQITAVGFGIGTGLALDEFALWLRLEDVYWTNEGRASLDAIVLATLFLKGRFVPGLVALHRAARRDP